MPQSNWRKIYGNEDHGIHRGLRRRGRVRDGHGPQRSRDRHRQHGKRRHGRGDVQQPGRLEVRRQGIPGQRARRGDGEDLVVRRRAAPAVRRVLQGAGRGRAERVDERLLARRLPRVAAALVGMVVEVQVPAGARDADRRRLQLAGTRAGGARLLRGVPRPRVRTLRGRPDVRDGRPLRVLHRARRAAPRIRGVRDARPARRRIRRDRPPVLRMGRPEKRIRPRARAGVRVRPALFHVVRLPAGRACGRAGGRGAPCRRARHEDDDPRRRMAEGRQPHVLQRHRRLDAGHEPVPGHEGACRRRAQGGPQVHALAGGPVHGRRGEELSEVQGHDAAGRRHRRPRPPVPGGARVPDLHLRARRRRMGLRRRQAGLHRQLRAAEERPGPEGQLCGTRLPLASRCGEPADEGRPRAPEENQARRAGGVPPALHGNGDPPVRQHDAVRRLSRRPDRQPQARLRPPPHVRRHRGALGHARLEP